jgi:tRNA/tmRNA/rRNA uracil-C5-methylase (TrmA/RlmC/RlmD family)
MSEVDRRGAAADGGGAQRRGKAGRSGRPGASDGPRRAAVRRPRPPERPDGPLLGAEVEVDVGPVAHGGHCVARHEGRVIFVRHALPGERVRVLVTEDTGRSYCRGDAIAVLTPSPDRVEPPCPHAGPGRCGGCDWQHASGSAQRALKAAVVREQLTRLGGLPDVPVEVEPLPGGLLGWRTRVRYAVTPDGHTGLHRHRSTDLEPVTVCPLGTDVVTATAAGERPWPGATAVRVVASTTGDRAILVDPAPPDTARPADDSAAPDAAGTGPPGTGVAGSSAVGPALIGPAQVGERAAGREWRVSTAGFWQVHPAAADALAACVLEMLGPRAGESALDLYAGAGLFAGVLADRVGPGGRVVAVEADPVAAADAAGNLAGTPWASVRAARVTAGLLGGLGMRPDVVVLDPPRTGIGPDLLGSLLDLGPRAVAYVACDPAALARDLRAATAAGYRLAALRAFDLFPMTHHVECVALLTP